MDTTLLPALGAFAFVTSVTPGPNNLMVLASGANHGVRRTVPHVLGIAGGLALMIALVGLGLIGVFDAVPGSYDVLKAVSVAYLLYLAWKIATAAPRPVPAGAADAARTTAADAARTAAPPLGLFQAAAFQWVNPKAWTMTLAALSIYAPTRTMGATVTVAAVFGVICLPSVGAWAVLGQGMQGLLASRRRLRVFNIAMGLLLVATLYPVVFV